MRLSNQWNVKLWIMVIHGRCGFKRLSIACVHFLFFGMHFLSAFGKTNEVLWEVKDGIVVDGSLGEWEGHPFKVLGCNEPYSREMSCIMYEGWGKDGLYLGVDVFDTLINDSNVEAEVNIGDFIEIFVDTRGVDFTNRVPHSRSSGMIWLDCFELINDEKRSISILDDNEVIYSDHNWTHQSMETDKRFYRGTSTFVRKNPGAWVSFGFLGNKFRVKCRYDHGGGICDVIVNGEIVDEINFYGRNNTLSEYADGYGDFFYYESKDFGVGQHNVRIQVRDPKKEGVSILKIAPGLDRKDSVWFDSYQAVPESSVVSATTSNDGRWMSEIFIPWNVLGVDIKDIGDSIRLGYKIYDDYDPNSARNLVLGLRRIEENTSLDWAILNPERFPELLLASNEKRVDVDAQLKEFLHNGESWLDLDVKIPRKDFGDGEGFVVLSVNGDELVYGLKRSFCGEYLYTRQYFKNSFRSDSKVKLEIRGSDYSVEPVTCYLPCSIKDALDSIEYTLPIKEIESIDEGIGNQVKFLKDCASEMAGYYSNVRNQDINHYDKLPYYADYGLLEKDIGTFLERGRMWLDEKFEKRSSELGFIQVWHSFADNSWQMFKLKLPKSFNRLKTYPVELIYHYENKKVFSRTEWALLEINEPENIADNRVLDEDKIVVSLFGRGNSFSTIGDSEFLYVQEWLKEKIPNCANDIRLFGRSKGGYLALLNASRYIDSVSLVKTSGSILGEVVSERRNWRYDDVLVYKENYNSFEDKIVNFYNIPVVQIVGQLDNMYLQKNLAFHRLVNNNGFYESRLDVIEGVEHFIPLGKETNPVVEAKDVSKIARNLHFKQHMLRYGKVNGVSVISKKNQWEPYEMKMERGLEVIAFSANNITKFECENKILKNENGEFCEVTINGMRVEVYPENSAMLTFVYENSNWITDIITEGEYMKFPGLEGPIGDIEKDGFIVVYGTTDSSSIDILKNRAIEIVRNRTGSDIGQWSGASFKIKADTEITEDELEKKNLWLIGNVDENSLVSRFANRFPFNLSSDRVIIGDTVYSDPNTFVEFVMLNPIYKNRYLFVEAAFSEVGYLGEIFRSRDFDYSVSIIDGKDNVITEKGIFDGNWKLKKGSIRWVKEIDGSYKGLFEK